MSDDGGDSDEPLADVAARVRERTGETPEAVDRSDREGPLADVANKVDERRQRDRESDDAFESVDVGELDGEKLWERLAEGDDGPTATMPPGESVAVDDGEWAGRDVRTIPKATCHSCPHFGDPPELACTHEGTAILAMTDADHFRVVDCPMVVDDEDIGGISVDDVAGDEGPSGGVSESDEAVFAEGDEIGVDESDEAVFGRNEEAESVDGDGDESSHAVDPSAANPSDGDESADSSPSDGFF